MNAPHLHDLLALTIALPSTSAVAILMVFLTPYGLSPYGTHKSHMFKPPQRTLISRNTRAHCSNMWPYAGHAILHVCAHPSTPQINVASMWPESTCGPTMQECGPTYTVIYPIDHKRQTCVVLFDFFDCVSAIVSRMTIQWCLVLEINTN